MQFSFLVPKSRSGPSGVAAKSSHFKPIGFDFPIRLLIASVAKRHCFFVVINAINVDVVVLRFMPAAKIRIRGVGKMLICV